jgi:hypothetical protein
VVEARGKVLALGLLECHGRVVITRGLACSLRHPLSLTAYSSIAHRTLESLHVA